MLNFDNFPVILQDKVLINKNPFLLITISQQMILAIIFKDFQYVEGCICSENLLIPSYPLPVHILREYRLWVIKNHFWFNSLSYTLEMCCENNGETFACSYPTCSALINQPFPPYLLKQTIICTKHVNLKNIIEI